MEDWKCMNIRTEILNALKLKNFTKPTKIQSESIPPAIEDQRDILGAAETGSGKTLAFAIPILNGILNARSNESISEESDMETESDSELGSDNENEPEVLEELDENGLGCVSVVNLPPDGFVKPKNKLWAIILVPTRELAMQVKNHIDDVAKYTGINIAAIVGGLSSEKQERLLRKGPEIVVATPGRLWELIQRNEPHLMQLNKVKYFVIDEADRMVETAHFPELHLMLEKINLKRNNKRQNFVFSATLTMVHKAPYRVNIKKKKHIKKNLSPEDKLKSLIQLIGMKNPHVVNLTTANCVTSTVKEMQIFCSVKEKDAYLFYFLKRNPGRSLVFCNSISCVKRLASILNILKLTPLPIHSNMIQKQRLKNLDKFRANDRGLLLATDVASRGLDIVGVNHVVHYDVPRTAEIYVHRSGRTARASNIGLSLLICTPDKKNVYLNVLRTMKREKELPRLEIELRLIRTYHVVVKLAQEIAMLEEKSKKETASTNWFSKAAEEMEILLDEDELPRGMGKGDLQKHNKLVNSKRKQLDLFLATTK
ncbi:RNA helicase, DEAD-box type, Q motif,Helicase, C-terminal,ATP-dependent RNA helicase DEAD-box, conserved [Cinara cedri]|uniref:ATP-dependent RNA helicase n=1 Tax=Cinara cedri TaxID=506608 RepID=A0A5E4NAC6_9HEMI|nr:RNA helicase, DEAD-box type, Q motif,Helicase, C-terminal,ATP-dependent RNA helicase DEAD-box, conserved [Cinara cedri]